MAWKGAPSIVVCVEPCVAPVACRYSTRLESESTSVSASPGSESSRARATSCAGESTPVRKEWWPWTRRGTYMRASHHPEGDTLTDHEPFVEARGHFGALPVRFPSEITQARPAQSPYSCSLTSSSGRPSPSRSLMGRTRPPKLQLSDVSSQRTTRDLPEKTRTRLVGFEYSTARDMTNS